MECPLCAHEVASDQRYCLACGGPCAPALIDWRAILGIGPAELLWRIPTAADPELEPETLWSLPSPRAAAVTVMAVLATGVAIGGSVSPPAVAETPRLIIVQAAQPKATASARPAPEIPEQGTGGAPAEVEPAVEPVLQAEEPAPADETTATKPAPIDEETDEPAVPTLPPVRAVWLVALGSADPESEYLKTELPASSLTLAAYKQASAPAALGPALAGGRVDDLPMYEPGAQTLADRFAEGGRAWRVYADSEPANPFLRFPQVGALPDRADSVLPLARLDTDLSSGEAVAAFSYVAAPSDPKAVIDRIRSSQAFADGGLVAVVEPSAADETGATTHPGRAWIASQYVEPGARYTEPTDEMSIARTLTELFGVSAPDSAAFKRAEPLDALAFTD